MALLLAIPLTHNGYIEIVFRGILMYATMAYGWNLIGGYTGYVSFGQVAFFGIGAYCSAVLSQQGIDNLFIDVLVACVVNGAFATQIDVTIGTQHISGSGLQDAIALVVLLIVLIVRPTGIVGKATA